MKLNMRIAVLLIGTMLAAGSALSQTMMHVDIPFGFNVGDSRLPAGEYTVSPLDARTGDVLVISSVDGRQQIFVQTSAAESANPAGENKLVFRCYGNQHYLSQIWIGEQAVRHILAVNNREREMARSARVQEASILAK
jgi:hypothetical protein